MFTVPFPQDACATARRMQFDFAHVQRRDLEVLRTWWRAPHVTPWVAGEPLRVVQADLEAEGGAFEHWTASLYGVQCGHLMIEALDGQHPRHARWLDGGIGVRVEAVLGEARMTGMGIGTEMIRQFLDLCPEGVTDVFAQPQVAHHCAIHVYEKLGFRIVDEFIPPSNPVNHCLLWARLPLPPAGSQRTPAVSRTQAV